MNLRTIALAAILGLTGGSSLAAECHYENRLGSLWLSFPEDGTAVVQSMGDMSLAYCDLEYGDEGANSMTCDNGERLSFGRYPASLNGDDFDELVVLDNILFYRVCP